MTTAAQVTAAALRHVGAVENPPGSNRTVFGVLYGWNGVSWCDIFVSEMGREASGGYGLVGKFAYTPTHANWFASQGRFGSTPIPGAIAFFDWEGGRSRDGIDHVEIVIRNLGGGMFVTVGGNTGSPEGVHIVQRSMALVVGFGYPNYNGGPTPPYQPPAPNEAVKRIQRIVGAGADGVLGPDTSAHILAWQKAHGVVPADGQWGPVTEAAYQRTLLPPSPQPQPVGVDRVKTSAIQTAVHTTVDGHLGPVTATAVTAIIRGPGFGYAVQYIQARIGTPVDGAWGPQSANARLATIKEMQHALRVTEDGAWGKITQAAWEKYYGVNIGR